MNDLILICSILGVAITLLGNMGVICYWAGTLRTEVRGLREETKSLNKQMKDEIVTLENKLAVETNKREDANKSLWNKLDHVAEVAHKANNGN